MKNSFVESNKIVSELSEIEFAVFTVVTNSIMDNFDNSLASAEDIKRALIAVLKTIEIMTEYVPENH